MNALISPKFSGPSQGFRSGSKALPSPSHVSSGVDEHALFLTDLDFFEQEIQRFVETLEEPLMSKRQRQGIMNSDPIEELSEVYSEVQVMEQDFMKTIEICQHLLKNGRDLFN